MGKKKLMKQKKNNNKPKVATEKTRARTPIISLFAPPSQIKKPLHAGLSSIPRQGLSAATHHYWRKDG